MARVLLIVPPYRCWGVQHVGSWPPLPFAYLAGAALGAGHEARICDAMNNGFAVQDIRTEIETFRPHYVVTLDYVPVSGAISTASIPAALSVLAVAKEVDPSIVTIIGGPHPTFLYDELLGSDANSLDVVLRGESEATLAELLSAIPQGRMSEVAGIAYFDGVTSVATPLRAHITDLEEVSPAWHLLDWDLYRYNVEPRGRMASVLTTRGCMMACSFCSHTAFWRGDWRGRDPIKVVEEIRRLVETYDVELVTLVDPYPTNDQTRWERQLDLLIEADLGVHVLMETRAEDIVRDERLLPKYREAGIIHVYLGVESGSQETLERVNKNTSAVLNARAIDLLREHEIISEASFMIGFPHETRESAERTAAQAVEMNPDIAVFPVITPMPFTPLYRELADRVRVFDYSHYNLTTPIIEPFAMSLEEVSHAMAACYLTFYRHKIAEVAKLDDGFRRRYLMSAFQEMMRECGDRFDFLGTLPQGMPGVHDFAFQR